MGQEQTSQNGGETIAQREARVHDEMRLPSSSRLLMRQVKSNPDEFITLVMTERGLQEFGGEANIRRILADTVRYERDIIAITDADMRYAESPEYRRVAAGETREEARSRFLHENFGPAINYSSNGLYKPQTTGAISNFWSGYTDRNQNSQFIGADNIRIINLNSEEDNRLATNFGTSQQRRDYLVGHEFDHSAQQESNTDLVDEILSDVAGIKAATEGAPLEERQRFTKGVIADRVQDLVDNTFFETKLGTEGQYISEKDLDHNTAPFLNAQDIDKTELPDSQTAMKIGTEFREELATHSTEFTERLLKYHDVPRTVGQALFVPNTDQPKSLYQDISTFFSAIEGNEDELDTIPERETILRYKEEFDLLEENVRFLPEHERNQERIDFLKRFNDDCPRIAEALFHVRIWGSIDSILQDPSIPPVLAEQYKQELAHIRNTEGDNLDIGNNFIARLIQEQPEAYERFMAKENPDFVIRSAYYNDKSAWLRASTETVQDLYREDKIEDPRLKRATEIYLEQNNMMPSPVPAAKPAVQPSS